MATPLESQSKALVVYGGSILQTRSRVKQILIELQMLYDQLVAVTSTSASDNELVAADKTLIATSVGDATTQFENAVNNVVIVS